MRTNLTSKLQLTDGLLTDQLTKRSRSRPLEYCVCRFGIDYYSTANLCSMHKKTKSLPIFEKTYRPVRVVDQSSKLLAIDHHFFSLQSKSKSNVHLYSALS